MVGGEAKSSGIDSDTRGARCCCCCCCSNMEAEEDAVAAKNAEEVAEAEAWAKEQKARAKREAERARNEGLKTKMAEEHAARKKKAHCSENRQARTKPQSALVHDIPIPQLPDHCIHCYPWLRGGD